MLLFLVAVKFRLFYYSLQISFVYKTEKILIMRALKSMFTKVGKANIQYAAVEVQNIKLFTSTYSVFLNQFILYAIYSCINTRIRSAKQVI